MAHSTGLLKTALIAAIVSLFLTPLTSHAIVIMVSGGTTTDIAAFLNSKYSNVTEIRQGNFANFAAPATQAALNGTGAFSGMGATNLVIIGRTLSSADYDNFDAAGYNALPIPVVSFTSYVSRQDSNRMGWHAGGATNNKLTAGNETVITAAGNSLFGAGPFDWHDSADGTFNGLGTGSVGGGDILATLGGDILVASWVAGDAPGNVTAAGVATFGGQRLLFNLDNDAVGSSTGTFASLTDAGEEALFKALLTVGLIAIPEPATASLALLGLGGLMLRRRRMA